MQVEPDVAKASPLCSNAGPWPGNPKSRHEGSAHGPGRELKDKWDTGKSMSLQTSTVHKGDAGAERGLSTALGVENETLNAFLKS